MIDNTISQTRVRKPQLRHLLLIYSKAIFTHGSIAYILLLGQNYGMFASST